MHQSGYTDQGKSHGVAGVVRIVLALAIFAIGTSAGPAESKAHRSHAARAEFQRTHPCPANGATKGSCPGFVVDHQQPICAGGADAPHNMAWQTVEEARAKDRLERAQCRKR